jgi:hypothetical protein
MHCIDEGESFLDGAFLQAFFHPRGDIDKSSPGRNMEPQFFPETLHVTLSSSFLFLTRAFKNIPLPIRI